MMGLLRVRCNESDEPRASDAYKRKDWVRLMFPDEGGFRMSLVAPSGMR